MTLFDASFYRNPYPVYDKLRASGPVQQIPDVPGPLPAWPVTGHDEARQIFAEPSTSKNTRKFQYLSGNAGVPGNVDAAVASTIIATGPPDHTRLRKLAAKAFTPASTEQLRPRITQITETLLDAMESHGRAGLVTTFTAPLPVTVISELPGVPEPDRENLRQWSSASSAEHDDAARRHAAGNLARYITGLIAARRGRPGDDLTSRLISARDTTGTLSDSELLSMIIVLLIAGHETTTLITNAACALLQHPAQLADLRGNPALIPAAIDEFLRYESPVAIATIRYTTEPTTVGGVTIPAGQIVMISPAAANHDPAQYGNPGELDISHDASRHPGFGHGIHHCLGAQLARAEAETAIPALSARSARLPGLSLDTSHENLRWRHTRLIRRLESLPVRWQTARIDRPPSRR